MTESKGAVVAKAFKAKVKIGNRPRCRTSWKDRTNRDFKSFLALSTSLD